MKLAVSTNVFPWFCLNCGGRLWKNIRSKTTQKFFEGNTIECKMCDIVYEAALKLPKQKKAAK